MWTIFTAPHAQYSTFPLEIYSILHKTALSQLWLRITHFTLTLLKRQNS